MKVHAALSLAACTKTRLASVYACVRIQRRVVALCGCVPPRVLAGTSGLPCTRTPPSKSAVTATRRAISLSIINHDGHDGHGHDDDHVKHSRSRAIDSEPASEARAIHALAAFKFKLSCAALSRWPPTQAPFLKTRTRSCPGFSFKFKLPLTVRWPPILPNRDRW